MASTMAAAWPVRGYVPGDLMDIEAIEAESYARPWDFNRVIRFLVNGEFGGFNRRRMLVVSRHGMALGYCLAEVRAEGMRIVRLGVAPARRRRGIASALLSESVKDAHGDDMPASVLVRESQLDAQRFLKHQGFACVEQRRGAVRGTGEDAYLFTRPGKAREIGASA